MSENGEEGAEPNIEEGEEVPQEDPKITLKLD